ncbi:hypothetical protein [Propionicicella superfundia]|uniref:hypothetical protein n=1 Tax=Propionicicella superfundia TaxID=348582 RepID=UPI0004120378|nr:hypothetical protein [Propionicicella superfundia]
MKRTGKWSRTTVAGIALTLGAVALAGGGITLTAAGYVDTTHARTASLQVSTEPEFQVGLSRNARMVDTGLGLSDDGNVYVWGLTSLNINGGASDPGVQKPPQRVPIAEGTVRQVTGQIYDANALDKDGHVWGWGQYNARNGTDATRSDGLPRQLRIESAWDGTGAVLDQIMTISSTEYAGAGIRADGTVWHWGSSTGYGGNSGAGASQLTGLPDPTVAGNKPVYLKGAYTNFFVILENGDVYYWGGTGGSSLPYGTGNAGATATKLTALNSWMKANVAPGDPYIVAIDGGINMGGALLSNGQVLSWSRTDASRTGRGAPISPAIVPTLSGITSMQFSFTGVALGKNDGSLWGYGASDDYGQFPELPTQIDTNVVQYAAGQGYYIWQKSDGTFWGRGYNPQGAIGLPIGSQYSNRQITSPSLSVVAQ